MAQRETPQLSAKEGGGVSALLSGKAGEPVGRGLAAGPDARDERVADASTTCAVSALVPKRVSVGDGASLLMRRPEARSGARRGAGWRHLRAGVGGAVSS